MPTPAEIFPEREVFYKEEIRKLKLELKDCYLENNDLRQRYNLALKLPEFNLSSSLLSSKSLKSQQTIPFLFLSDWHWGEVVEPSEISFFNEFDVATARNRSESCFQQFVHFYKKEVNLKFPGIVLLLGGDMVSGEIHEDLTDSNEVHTMESVIQCAEAICDGIDLLLKQFGKITVFCVVGNHGRSSKKTRYKKKTSSNFDWMIYAICNLHFSKSNNVEFCIPNTSECLFTVFNTSFLLTHGDTISSYTTDSITGAISAIAKGDEKLRKRQEAMGDPYDILVCGHWHQYSLLPRRIINGSLKGYDEFGFYNSFLPEKPIQASWLLDKEVGITISYPIYCDR